jgi:hypothetical protein
MVEALESWRTLLREAREDQLSKKKITGLIGELLMLRDLADQTDNPLQYWQGPEGHTHDLVAKDLDVEIKTSTRRNDRRIHIQSLNQLESSKPELYLHFVRLSPAPEGITAPGLVDELVDAGVSRSALYEKLGLLGYLPQDREEYEDLTFEVEERLTYPVDGPEFPRITHSDIRHGVPDAVKSINYDIDLDEISIEPVSSEQFEGVLKDIAGQQ